jgi:eukaryotic-like serine/threonine-protein kinase
VTPHTDASPPLAPGSRVGRYELLRLLGRGGMGEVWQARIDASSLVPTYFALKVLRSGITRTPDARAGLVDEARLAAQIQSPHVVRVVELVEADGALCVVMEWIDGAPLDHLQDEGTALPLGVALRIAADVCAGLHAAHELRNDAGESLELIHRDISPQNILVDRGGTSKLIDFGIAKAKGRLVKETTSAVKGKLAYMSREQAAREPMDRRSDVFALGTVLYEMLTGVLPFPGDSDIALFAALATRTPMQAPPKPLPAPVLAILKRALSHDPAARFATALAMRVELESAMVECSVPTDATDVARAFAGRFPERAPSGVSSSSPPQARSATLRSAPPPTMRLPSLPGPAPRGFPAGALLGAGALVLAILAGLGSWTFTRSHAVAAPEPPRQRNDDLRAATPIVLGTAGAPSVTSTPRAVDPSRPHTQPTAEVAPTAPPQVPTAAPAASAASTTPASCDPPWIIDGLGHRRYRPECLH